MKLSKLILENTIQPIHKRVLRAMTISLGETDDVSEIWAFLTKDLNISDTKLKSELTHLFINSFREDGNYADLSDSELENIDDYSNYDNEHIALSISLNLPPSLIIEEPYSHYGLNVYKDLEDDSVYAVGDDDEANRAMEEYYDGWIDDNGIENLNSWDLEGFIELDYYTLDELATQEAQNMIDNLDDDDILSEAGYDKDEITDEIESIEARIEEITDEISDLDNEMSDLEDDNEEGENDSDIDSISIKIRELNSDLEDLERQLENEQSRLDSLLDDAKEELLDKYTEDQKEEIENEGLDYFINNMGYTMSQAIDSFYSFDKSGLITYLSENEDRGNTLSYYDGYERDQDYDGKTYYIYQME